MTGSEKINAFIEAEGKGNVRDALNVALTRIELLQIEKAGLIEMLDTSEPIGSIADKIISGISAPHDQHTPTPWTASENDWYIVAKSGHICEMIGPHGYETQRANARRIVAAVNATANIKTEVLESIAHPGGHSLLDGASWKNEAMIHAKLNNQAWDKVEQLQSQNARLLEALKEIVEICEPSNFVLLAEKIEAIAVPALAEAETNAPAQKPTYGTGPMIQERPRPEEADLEDENQPVTA